LQTAEPNGSAVYILKTKKLLLSDLKLAIFKNVFETGKFKKYCDCAIL
jgi:hypothetical protein